MPRRREDNPDPPCDHYDAMIGTIAAGDLSIPGTPFCGAATCVGCVTRSAGYVQMRTGLPAGELVTYEDARRQGAES